MKEEPKVATTVDPSRICIVAPFQPSAKSSVRLNVYGHEGTENDPDPTKISALIVCAIALEHEGAVMLFVEILGANAYSTCTALLLVTAPPLAQVTAH